MCAAFSSEGAQDRLRSLEELTEFTESCRAQLTEVFNALGWEPDWETNPQEKMDVCCYDTNHTVPSRSMEKHKATCQLFQLGYSKEDQAEMCEPSFCYERANIPNIKLDKHEQQQVILQARVRAPPVPSTGFYCQSDYSTEPADVPQNHKRAVCDLTVADRLALYDHVIQKAIQQRANAQSSSNEDLYVDLVSKLNKGEEQSGPKSHLEVLAEMRDYKRRRQSYRAKNVHITKKSYTEVIREVINVHSGELARLWQEEREEESKAAQHLHRRPSGEGRSGSVESRESHTSLREESSSRHRRHRKRSRDRSQERESKSRRRDSRSPDERHHKKKKKKKDKS
ncbi:U11/U12 small nuclear ribonucleoprotein 48 kDa protein isoform X1 [Colossoma macropomum]|uniref:U11/U12 small nuclear ribonucleoprotein 48 kDa protein isoform X1 n=1 Tax=Colossoma macropomum TaxID=42526 RepID=UPI001864E521|nr:U11/U12 small nuclear ribonucleoprotein 48 kDa protein isoform X1 [Colossoma macropomum]